MNEFEQNFGKAMEATAPEVRTARLSVKCRFCHEKWMEDQPLHDWKRNLLAVGQRHNCVKRDFSIERKKVNEIVEQVRKTRASKRAIDPIHYLDVPRDEDFKTQWDRMTRGLFITKRVQWKDTGNPTKCGARCLSAKGTTCDCVCRGKNHGSSWVQ